MTLKKINLLDFFKPNLSFCNHGKDFKNKKEILKHLAIKFEQRDYAFDWKEAYNKFIEREVQDSTAMNNRIAIPHLRSSTMKKPVIAFLKTTEPVDWKAQDKAGVRFVFAIAIPEKDASEYVPILAELSKLLMNKHFIGGLLSKATSRKNFIDWVKFNLDNPDLAETEFVEEEPEKLNKPKEVKVAKNKPAKVLTKTPEPKTEPKPEVAKPIEKPVVAEVKQPQTQEVVKQAQPKGYDIVAVTACPTGIAHTFLAAESLNQEAKKLGISIKVETQGTDGAKNVLTQSEIDNAKGVILATDKAIETYRFKDHKNVLEMGTKKVIYNPKKEIAAALNGEGKKLKFVLGSDDKNTKASSFKTTNGDELSFYGFHKRLYKAVLNGVSYMLPFVVFGGIMIALGFLLDSNYADYTKNDLTQYFGPDIFYGTVTAPAWWVFTIGKLTFGLIVPILAAYIAYALVGKYGLLPGFVLGLMSQTGILYGPRTFFNLDPDGAQSGFFGAIFGAFLAAAVIILLSKALKILPSKLDGIKKILIIPLIGTAIAAVVFYFANVPLVYLNTGFNQLLTLIDSNVSLSILLGLLVGAMMGSDLGGPINKAAYLFGVTTLNSSANGNSGSTAMAAVMVAGMMPPLVIAASTSFANRKYWTKEDITNGYGNWIFGLTFITEGAIPYTAKRPILIPVNIFSGALAGLISASLGITLKAPHGGIFVFPLLSTKLEALKGYDVNTLTGIGVGFYFLAILVSMLFSVLLLTVLLSNETKIKAWFNKNFRKNKRNKEQVNL